MTAALSPPRGWFAVATAAQLRRGRTVTARVNGRDLVVFRTAGGAVGALDAVCPHLGAHFGVGGRVVGDALRCPFHGFTFATDGRCTAAYGADAPSGLRAPAWPAVERAGIVLVWSDPDGDGPAWEVPPIDVTGWSPWATRRYAFAGHPQETTENAADIGHFAVLHGYHEVETVHPLTTDGPTLTASYGMLRPFRRLGPLRRVLPRGLRVRFDIVAHGIGWSLVEATVPTLGVTTRQLVCATPSDEGRVAMLIGAAARAPFAGLLGRIAARAIAQGTIVSLAHDVRQDVPIWNAKAHLPRPRLVRGDGPILRYRAWAEQFASGPRSPVPSDDSTPARSS